MNNKIRKGSLYFETIMALALFSFLAVTFIKFLPNTLKTIKQMIIYSKLDSISQYIGSYLFRWGNLSGDLKFIDFSSYSDGDTLELGLDRRVNQLFWDVSPELSSTYLTDEYKVLITMHDMNNRVDSAGLHVLVWYDTNLDNLLDDSEYKFNFSLTLSKKD